MTGRRVDPPQAQTTVEKVKPGGLTAGDTAVLVDRDGTLRTVRVRVARSLMRGRLHRITVEHQDGSVEERLLARDLAVYLMPDLPPDRPVAPDGPRREFVSGDQIRVGDTVTVNSRRPYDRGYREVVVTSVRGTIFKYDDGEGGELGDRLVPTHMRVRHARGEASADQPWTITLPDDDPTEVAAKEIRVGDRIDGGDALIPLVGTVIEIDQITGEGEDGEAIPGQRFLVADDAGSVVTWTQFGDDKVTRLLPAGDNIAGIIEEGRRDALVRQQQRKIRDELATIQQSVADRVTNYAIIATSGGKERVIEAIEQGRDEAARMLVPRSAHRLVRALDLDETGGESGDTIRTAATRLTQDMANRLADQVIEAVRGAEPMPDEGNDDRVLGAPSKELLALARVLRQYRDTPPSVDVATIGDAFAAAAEQLRAAGGRRERLPAELPEVAGDLPVRMEGYRRSLGVGFGQATVRRAAFEGLSLEALERGEVPGVVYENVGITDTAVDGGPGETALTHLAVVQAAGRDMDAAYDAEVRIVFAEQARKILGSDFREGESAEEAQTRIDAAYKAAGTRTREVEKERAAAYKAATTAMLEGTPYADLNALFQAATGTQDPDERLRLRRMHGEIESAARMEQQRLAPTSGYDEAYTTWRTLSDKLADMRRAVGLARREAALRVLSRVRPMGGPGLSYTTVRGQKNTERNALVKAMRFAESSFPADWLAALARGGSFKLARTTRGNHRQGERSMRLNPEWEPFDGAPRMAQVATHELGHTMEYTVPGLLNAEMAYLWSRTATGEVGARQQERKRGLVTISKKGKVGRSRVEAAFEDQFPDVYTGKTYNGDTFGPGGAQAAELVSTGVESLMAGAKYLDDDFRQWLFGVLALL